MKRFSVVNLPIRIILCGLGFWGLNWLDNIRENKNYNLVGIVEKNSNTLEEVKKSKNIPYNLCFNDIDNAINITKPDAAAVIITPDKHGEIIKPAIERGIHILSEKPLAKDLKEAKEFLNLHKKYSNIRFIVNQNYRGRDTIALIKNLLNSAIIGDIGYFVYNHQQFVGLNGGFRLEIESPIVEDMAIHHFDLLRYLTGQEFKEIYASDETVSWSWFKGRPLMHAIIDMSNSVNGIYTGSWVSEGKVGAWDGNIQIYGSSGSIELTDEGKVFLYKKRDNDRKSLRVFSPGEEIKPTPIKFTELQYTLENFKNSLVKGIKCETDIEDNIKSFTAVLASQESIRLKRPVAINSLGLF